MVRIRNAATAHKRKKRVLKQAKGQFGHRSRRYQQAKRSIIKGMMYAYRDRKVKQREFRRLWILRINAACREAGVSYSRFMNGLKRANIEIDRKVLSELAISSPDAFKNLVRVSKETGILSPNE
jgi:large subunit ribosomal protein L20